MTEEWTVWMAIALIALGTFGLRFAFFAFAGRVALPARLTRALRFVPAAILSAIILPALMVTPGGGINTDPTDPRLLAGLAAGLIAWKTRNMLATICLGMLLLWGLTALLR